MRADDTFEFQRRRRKRNQDVRLKKIYILRRSRRALHKKEKIEQNQNWSPGVSVLEDHRKELVTVREFLAAGPERNDCKNR